MGRDLAHDAPPTLGRTIGGVGEGSRQMPALDAGELALELAASAGEAHDLHRAALLVGCRVDAAARLCNGRIGPWMA